MSDAPKRTEMARTYPNVIARVKQWGRLYAVLYIEFVQSDHQFKALAIEEDTGQLRTIPLDYAELVL